MRLILISTLLFIAFSSASAQEEYDFLLRNQTKFQKATVQEVITANLILIDSYQKKGKKIKLIGLKALRAPERKKRPERDKHGFKIEEEVNPVITIEEASLEFVKNLLEGKEIRIEFDRYKNDANFDTVAYIFLEEDNLFVNAEILRQGYANPTSDPRNRKYKKELKEAYQEARREKRGLQGQ